MISNKKKRLLGGKLKLKLNEIGIDDRTNLLPRKDNQNRPELVNTQRRIVRAVLSQPNTLMAHELLRTPNNELLDKINSWVK